MDALRKKLRYQSWHRGCKETDDILGPFADHFLPACSEEEAQAFQCLLQEDDRAIWHWLTGKETIPPQHVTFLKRILHFQENRHP